MSDTDASTQSASDAQAASGADAQAQEATGSAQAAAGDSSSLSPEDARKLRSEAKNLRDRLRALEAEKAERDEADLTATQRLEREKTALAAEKAQLETRLRDANVQAVAAKLGVKTDLVDTVASLIDWTDVDADDTKAIERAVKELVKERPSLSGRPEGLDGGRRGSRQGETDMNSLIRRAAGRA